MSPHNIWKKLGVLPQKHFMFKKTWNATLIFKMKKDIKTQTATQDSLKTHRHAKQPAFGKSTLKMESVLLTQE